LIVSKSNQASQAHTFKDIVLFVSLTEASAGMGERQVWLVKVQRALQHSISEECFWVLLQQHTFPMQVPTFLGKRWRSACDESKSKEAGPELGSIQQVSATEVCVSMLILKLSQDTSNHMQ